MGRERPQHRDVSEDGHPCEAALEFRRAAIRFGVAEEVGADSLDLAVAFAWIGKAVSRTTEAWPWVAAGSDPNTWLMVRAMACDAEGRRVALRSALSAPAAPGFEADLAALRASRAFFTAAETVSRTVSGSGSPEMARLADLAGIARQLPGPERTRPPELAPNVVAMRDFRRNKGR